MPEIVLSEEQARVLAGATTAVVVRAPGGAAVGVLDPAEAEIIAEARRRLALPGRGVNVPAAAVQAHLDALQAEWDRTGGFDPAHARATIDRMRTADRDG